MKELTKKQQEWLLWLEEEKKYDTDYDNSIDEH